MTNHAEPNEPAVTPPAPLPTEHASLIQKIILVALLIISGLILLYYWFDAFQELESRLQKEYGVKWTAPARLILKPGPPTFFYDATSHELKHIGSIDSKRKEELLALVETKGTGAPSAGVQSYWEAIDRLAYTSNDILRDLIVRLVVLGTLTGALGVQFRSMVNFIGVTCYKKSLDVPGWWPYYVLRPVIGAILGAVSVLIVEAGMFETGGASPSAPIWRISLAFLAGFGSDEFTQRLRSLTQTLFGQKA